MQIKTTKRTNTDHKYERTYSVANNTSVRETTNMRSVFYSV